LELIIRVRRLKGRHWWIFSQNWLIQREGLSRDAISAVSVQVRPSVMKLSGRSAFWIRHEQHRLVTAPVSCSFIRCLPALSVLLASLIGHVSKDFAETPLLYVSQAARFAE
jgi:hypothetical protein